MNHRSLSHMFVRTALAALAIVVGATLAAPVGGLKVLAVTEPAPQEAIVPAPSPVSAASASRAALLPSGVTEPSNIASPAGLVGGAVHLAGSIPSVPSRGPGAGGAWGTPFPYAGMLVHEICTFPADGMAPPDCGWEVAAVFRDLGFCIVGLTGVGRLVRARKIAEKLEELTNAIERAMETRRMNRDIMTGFLSVLAGDCVDLIFSLREMDDCLNDGEATTSLPALFHKPALGRLKQLEVVVT